MALAPSSSDPDLHALHARVESLHQSLDDLRVETQTRIDALAAEMVGGGAQEHDPFKR